MPWGLPLKPSSDPIKKWRVFLAISLLVNILLGTSFILASDEVDSLQAEMNILQTELAQLDVDLRDKTISTRELENRVTLLQARLTLLQSDYGNLVSENRDLLTQITNLRIQTTQLKLEITRLQVQVSQLQSSLTRLKEVAGSSIYYDSTTLYLGSLACTGSMRPTFDCGDIVIRYTPQSSTEISVGDIITYYIPSQYDYCFFAGQNIIHRVVRTTWDQDYVFWTKGDNNSVEDNCGVPFWAVTSKVIGVVWT